MDIIVAPVKKYIRKRDPASIDNFAFKLHYRATFVVLLVCMMLVSAKQFIGDPIRCIADGVPGGTLDLYCWIHSTFSVPSRWGRVEEVYANGLPHEVAQHHPHPGIAPIEPGEEVVYHKYYQWVVFVLFLQATMFHLPRIIWKHSEGGLMRRLVGDLTNPVYLIKKDERMDQVMFIKKFFKEEAESHGNYAFSFFLCEFLSLLNVFLQMYITDRFLGFQFSTYGWDVLTMAAGNPEDSSNPMNVVFPKVTKCTFHMYGPSGTLTTHDGLCVLALNIINEKIYIFLWFWFIGVAIFSIITFIYRIFVITIPSLRVSIIMARTLFQVDQTMVEDILRSSNQNWLNKVGHYWVIYLLSKNLSPIAMKELLEELRPVLHPGTSYEEYQLLNKKTDL